MSVWCLSGHWFLTIPNFENCYKGQEKFEMIYDVRLIKQKRSPFLYIGFYFKTIPSPKKLNFVWKGMFQKISRQNECTSEKMFYFSKLIWIFQFSKKKLLPKLSSLKAKEKLKCESRRKYFHNLQLLRLFGVIWEHFFQ